jgi:hypothetical protein
MQETIIRFLKEIDQFSTDTKERILFLDFIIGELPNLWKSFKEKVEETDPFNLDVPGKD